MLVFFLTIALGASVSTRASVPTPSVFAAPTIEDCGFFPNPRVNVSISCGDDNSLQPGFLDVPVRFRVNVTGETDLNVTFSFDYYNPNGSGGPPVVNPDSPVRVLAVSPPGPGNITTVETAWTYAALSNFSSGSSSTYWVYVEVRDQSGQVGTWSPAVFPIVVNRNSEPSLSGLNTVNSVSESIRSQTRQIPLLYINVSAGDPDSDNLTITWEWGDGTRTVIATGPTVAPVDVNVTHQYAADRFPLNETPRFVRFPITVWVDDAVGHNLSFPSSAEFYVEFDSPPVVRWDKPQVNSLWKVGERVPMVGNVSDPEGDPLVVYWDFDNRTDSDGDGDPTRDRDANGSTAAHAYASPGVYNISLWATDGESKNWCFDLVNCTSNASGFVSHWVRQVIPIRIQLNQVPVLAFTNSTAIKGQLTRLRAAVFDPDGDSMVVTWDFGDGTANATNVTGSSPRESPAIVQVFQEHTYTETGPHNVTLMVSDGNSTAADRKEVFVESFNEPPTFLSLRVFRANGSAARDNTFLVGATVTANITVYDFENDPLEVRLDWRDGNVTVVTVDPKTAANCTLDDQNRTVCWVSFSHAYEDTGRTRSRSYAILVTLTDHEEYIQRDPPIVRSHSKTQTLILFVINPSAEGLGPWDWWDYSTFAAVVGLPVALIGRWVYKVRKEREEE